MSHIVDHFNDYKDNYHFYQFVYMYPRSNVQEWLEYKTTKDYIIIDCFSAPPSPLLGFIFWFALDENNQDKEIYMIERYVANIIASVDKDEGSLSKAKKREKGGGIKVQCQNVL